MFRRDAPALRPRPAAPVSSCVRPPERSLSSVLQARLLLAPDRLCLRGMARPSGSEEGTSSTHASISNTFLKKIRLLKKKSSWPGPACVWCALVRGSGPRPARGEGKDLQERRAAALPACSVAAVMLVLVPSTDGPLVAGSGLRQAARQRLRAVEGGEAPGAVLGLPVGRRATRLAHRVLHHRQVSLSCADLYAGWCPARSVEHANALSFLKPHPECRAKEVKSLYEEKKL